MYLHIDDMGSVKQTIPNSWVAVLAVCVQQEGGKCPQWNREQGDWSFGVRALRGFGLLGIVLLPKSLHFSGWGRGWLALREWLAAFSWGPAATLPFLPLLLLRWHQEDWPWLVPFSQVCSCHRTQTFWFSGVLLSGDRYILPLFFPPGPGWQHSPCPVPATPTPRTSLWLFPVTFDLGLEARFGILGLEPKPFLGKFLGFLSDSRTVAPWPRVLARGRCSGYLRPRLLRVVRSEGRVVCARNMGGGGSQWHSDSWVHCMRTL